MLGKVIPGWVISIEVGSTDGAGACCDLLALGGVRLGVQIELNRGGAKTAILHHLLAFQPFLSLIHVNPFE